MKLGTAAFVTSAMMVLGAVPSSAHDEFRIIGTITKPGPKSLEVKTKDGKTVSVALNAETFVSRDRKKADASELKAGGSVVIDALGDSYADLVALEVRIVPSITAPTK